MYILDTRWKQVHNAIHHRETLVNVRKDRVSFAQGGVPVVLEQKQRSFGSVCIYWPLYKTLLAWVGVRDKVQR